MQVLIFGGSGFIGRHLIPLLINEGYQIIAFTRNPGAIKAANNNRVKWVNLDLQDINSIVGYCSGEYSVINLAGESIGAKLWTKKQKEKILSSRVQLTKAIVDAINLSDTKPVAFIQGSAVGYYGSQPDKLLDEYSNKGEGFLSDVVEKWEKTLELKEAYKARIIFIRTGIVIGNDGGILPLMMLPFKFYAGGIPGNGKQWIPWIHIGDAVKAILFLLKNENSGGIYNLASPGAVQMKEFVSSIAEVTGKPLWLNVPETILKLLPGGMADDLVLTSQRVLPVRLQNDGFRFDYPDIKIAMENLLAKKN